MALNSYATLNKNLQLYDEYLHVKMNFEQ